MGDVESPDAHYPVEHANKHLELAVLIVVECLARIHFWVISGRKGNAFLAETSKHGFDSAQSFRQVPLAPDGPSSVFILLVVVAQVVVWRTFGLDIVDLL